VPTWASACHRRIQHLHRASVCEQDHSTLARNVVQFSPVKLDRKPTRVQPREKSSLQRAPPSCTNKPQPHIPWHPSNSHIWLQSRKQRAIESSLMCLNRAHGPSSRPLRGSTNYPALSRMYVFRQFCSQSKPIYYDTTSSISRTIEVLAVASNPTLVALDPNPNPVRKRQACEEF
jgi:hypothetical protein